MPGVRQRRGSNVPEDKGRHRENTLAQHLPENPRHQQNRDVLTFVEQVANYCSKPGDVGCGMTIVNMRQQAKPAGSSDETH